ncbi:uncharacterized protein LOC106137123 [Amyelois transitella]|uniref:uncharacterized protein LOC106137123 n=1 Tax=Amyelois transitella TaxID=680683 RepID=UPI00298FFC4B|nr:uncharacterized protein LOC106137123 [Amyelois transitella]XP_060807461.1 uncharacterized protein LOC106137123 [Amyelois transitella]
MSVLNQSGEEQVECPLCMEPLEVDDLHFYPCTCGYQICRFCWNRIREGENGLCPACRKAYPENPADFTPLSQEQVAAIKTEKKAREQKRRNKTLESRRALANVRVVQNNLVFVVGLPVRLADPEILKRQEYFGKYGKIHKVVINQSTAYAGSQGPSASAYVTYVSPADALRAIQGVSNVALDGRVLKGSLGTTKYCANFMKNQPCPKPDCMYLHELGDPKASFTKEEMHAGLHQVYERKLHNQLQQATRDTPTDKQYSSSGNSSTSAEKSSSKDGNQSNNSQAAAVTSPNINVVNSSKSKKECNGVSESGAGGDKSGKEAWPSLAEPPAPASPAPAPAARNKSQENGTSESSSPTQLTQQAQTNTKSNKDHTDKTRSKDSTNPQPNKKSKSDKKKSNSINDEDKTEKHTQSSSTSTVFEADSHQYLTNELDELESDRHSLLENHDLLDNSEHNLLEDDTHSLLTDPNNDVMMMLRHKEMFAGLVENNMAKPLNGYGLLDRDTISYLGNDRQISQKIPMGKVERDLRREEMLRQNEMLARQRALEHKHYLPAASIAMDSASEMLGANYHPNPSMLPPFGMRIDNSMGTSLGMNTMANMNTNLANNMPSSLTNNIPNNLTSNLPNGLTNSLQNGMVNNMTNSLVNNMPNSLVNNMPSSLVNNMPNSLANNMPNSLANNMPNSLVNNMSNLNNMQSNMNSIPAGFMMHNQMLGQQQQQQMQQNALVNGFDAPQSSEGRYLAENMDKFFTDFHKAQQRRLMLSREELEPQQPHMFARNMLSAERLEMEHKQRMNNLRVGESSARAAGDGDDDLDFDPFKETQKALQEMMETEMMQGVSSGDNMERVRRARLAPPGFGHLGLPQPRPVAHHAGYTSQQNSFSDWTQLDPAIVSTSVSRAKGAPQGSLTHQQQELFAQFSQLSAGGWAPRFVPLPPGFAPAKRPLSKECIDAK